MTSIEMLISDFEEKKKKNPRFSKRSYASYLKISSGRLSDILTGKSPLTEKKALAIVGKLNLTPQEQRHFLRLVENESHSRVDGRRRVKSYSGRRLALEEFALVSDWEYFSLMALIETETFQANSDWIAEKLGLTKQRAEEVLEKLVALGYVQRNAEGALNNTYKSLSTITDIPSDILRKANADCILQAIEKMNETDVDLRDVTSLTLPVDLSKLKQAKALIREFKAQMNHLLDGEKKTEVYNLNIQLVPVSKLGI